MNLTEEQLAKLPTKGGFRLRGEKMTRIEVFSDAAFAFAVTMLVVSPSSIPQNFQELVEAIKGVPAFAASFACIMVFWAAHRSWSRRFGLEDGISTSLTLCLIFIVLVYVYPLKIVVASFFHWVSGGWLPSHFEINNTTEMTGLIIIYGLGVMAVTLVQLGLYLRVRQVSQELCLNAYERLNVDQECTMWLVHVLVSLLSVIVAAIFYSSHGYYATFLYFILPIVMPIIAARYKKKAQKLGTVTSPQEEPI